MFFWFFFFFYIDISCWLFFLGSVETQNLCPLVPHREVALCGIPFCIRSNSNNKNYFGLSGSVSSSSSRHSSGSTVRICWGRGAAGMPRRRQAGNVAGPILAPTQREPRLVLSLYSSGTQFHSYGLIQLSHPCMSQHPWGFEVLCEASEQKADEGGGTDTSEKSFLSPCSLPARGVEGERCQRSEPGRQITEPGRGVSAPQHCCWADERLQGPGQG